VLLAAGAARAQVVVSDPLTEANTLQSLVKEVVAATKRVEMINNQIIQIQHLIETVNAVAHGNVAALSSLTPELGALGLTSPLGTDTAELVQAISGLASSAGATGLLGQQIMSTDRYYAPSASDFRAIALNQASAALAQQKALAQLALDSNTRRLTELTTLRTQLGSTADVKAAADATARLTGEQATAQAQTNQLIAAQILQAAQSATTQAREEQAWRCSAEAFVAQAKAAADAANAGSVTLISTGTPASARCTITSGTGSSTSDTTIASAGTMGTAVGSPSAAPDDGSALAKMESQPWGQAAATNAAALGVNPTALAATCVLESGCSANVGGAGTISGTFQMSNGTYAETVSAVQASNPDLASQITTKNDPASQSIAASQYLKQGAQSLQTSGIGNPTVMDVRSYYQFGPANAASVANAPDNQLMMTTLTGLSNATLAANNINGTTTVGQWRQSVTGKIGSAASQPVLLGGNAT
jgi:hypothetical protein